MKTSRRFTTYFVFGLTALLTLSVIYFAYAHADHDQSSKQHKGASASATAKHYHLVDNDGAWKNYQSASHHASLIPANHPIGYSVSGEYKVYAYVAGLSNNSGTGKSKFKLKITPKKIFGIITVGKKGDSHSDGKFDYNETSTATYAGSANAWSKCDTVQTRTVSTSKN